MAEGHTIAANTTVTSDILPAARIQEIMALEEGMLEERFIAVTDVCSRFAFRDEVIQFSKRLGFDKVSAMTVEDHILGEPKFTVVQDMPTGYHEQFHSRSMYLRDPVMQHCKRRGTPIVWTQDDYTSHGQGDKWEAMASFGLRTGIAIAMHLPDGKHFFIGVDRDQGLPKCKVEVTRLVSELQLFAVHAQEAAFRVLLSASADLTLPRLRPREREALKWTMDGKTAWEVGAIMNISERTAVFHLSNSIRKLGCVNKHHAVIKALRLGLIR